MLINGELSASGGDGAKVITLNSADFPALGGRGGPGGGSGGDGTPQVAHRSFAGMTGNGPGNSAGRGGSGGILAAHLVHGRGSGGGGGAFATLGEPHYGARWLAGTSFVQQLGLGGYGGFGASGNATRSLPGGGPGGTPFRDAFDDNDFFGYAIDVFRNRVVVGELPLPIGGSGGGGGGAGSGGTLILVSEQEIELHVKGETYANRDYDFVLSADGGVCTTGLFGTPIMLRKYPANGVPVNQTTAINYDSAPLGGFGGMGVIQLVAYPGNNADGTNTILDDHIVLLSNGVPLTGAVKQRYLAWRGFANPAGVRVDDFGMPTNIGADEGDIRPSPVLMALQ